MSESWVQLKICGAVGGYPILHVVGCTKSWKWWINWCLVTAINSRKINMGPNSWSDGPQHLVHQCPTQKTNDFRKQANHPIWSYLHQHSPNKELFQDIRRAARFRQSPHLCERPHERFFGTLLCVGGSALRTAYLPSGHEHAQVVMGGAAWQLVVVGFRDVHGSRSPKRKECRHHFCICLCHCISVYSCKEIMIEILIITHLQHAEHKGGFSWFSPVFCSIWWLQYSLSFAFQGSGSSPYKRKCIYITNLHFKLHVIFWPC